MSALLQVLLAPSVLWGVVCVLICMGWLLREVVWSSRVQAAKEETEQARQQTNALLRHQATLQFQQEWATSIIAGATEPQQLLHRLSRWLPNAREASLWLVDRTSGRADSLQVAAGDRDLIRRVTVSPQLWDQLEVSERLRLETAELRHMRLLRMPSELSQTLSGLYVIRCGTSVPVQRLLCTTHLPQWTEAEVENLKLLEWTCRHWNPPRPEPVALEAPGTPDEARMVRIMLELRTIADMEFESPMEMLREFLRTLARATGFERVSLYLTRHGESETIERFCWAGVDVDHDALDAWHRLEDSVIQQHLHTTELILLTPERFVHWTSANPVVSGAVMPLDPADDPMGLLCLTSRFQQRPSAAEQQIISWAARFLLQTLAKTVDRVVVEDQARRDSLTRLANRHTFDSELQRQLKIAQVTDELCSLILFDLDHFKQINDTYGHPGGDAVLVEVGRRIEEVVSQTRVTDRPLVARLGGEELAVLLPGVGHAGALRIAESIRHMLRDHPVPFEDQSIHITTSAGIAVCPRNGRTGNELIAAADAALYAAKSAGRDCVHTAAPVERPDERDAE
ncbi:MAG: GGDEF domain-containing protein [Planctomycetaceae bacterium]|nr:GGDEF domain-containing protein [Planctomycetaceae bacterium]